MSTSPDSTEPYKRVIWDRVHQADQLKDLQIVELRDGQGNNYARYQVRWDESKEGPRLRFKDPDTGENVHFYVGAMSLVESGLVYRRLESDLRVYDVWATLEQAWSYRGEGDWLELTTEWLQERTDRERQIPDNAVLMWRKTTVEG